MIDYQITVKVNSVDELLELAGMNQNTTPFNLEKALTGEPVVTRDGKEVTQLTLFTVDSVYNLAGVVDGVLLRYTSEGEYLRDEFHELDLLMKAKTRAVNGFEVPAPVTNPGNMEHGDTYYVAESSSTVWHVETFWTNDKLDKELMNRNLVFMNKEDAIANAKAMVGVNPYGGCDE